MSRHTRTIATAVGAFGLLAGIGLTAAPQASADGRRALPDTAPTWVGSAHSDGATPDASRATVQIYLAPHGGIDALKAAVEQVSTPGSAQYGHYLTAAQYHRAYDPTAAEAAQVQSYLAANGMRVTATGPDRRYLEATGTTAAAEDAFGTTIKTFEHDGRTVQANTTAVTLPDAVAPLVLTVTGLDTTPHLITHAPSSTDSDVVPATTAPAASTPAPPPTGFVPGRPCSAYYGQLAATYKADYRTPLPQFQGRTLPYVVCGYVGSQYRPAYQGTNRRGLDGSGVTIAVLDAYAAPTITSDISTYAALHADGAYAPGQFKQRTPAAYANQDACDPSGWFGEETLDIEAEHAMAPGADIRYYAAASCYDEDFIAALGRIVDENKAAVVSNSWGDVESNTNASTVAAYDQVFLQGAMQGITFTFSSGDDGDELADSGLLQATVPDDDPYVVAVGGTSDAIGADNTFAFQTGWGTEIYPLSSDGQSWVPGGFIYGAGGGVSHLFPQPSYQHGVVPSSASSGRAVPDVAMDADPNTGFLVGETQTFSDGVRYGEYRIGGTSLASPLYAGQTALLIQRNAGARLGFVNPLLYGRMRTSGRFTDIAGSPPDPGNVRVNYVNGEDASGGLSYSVRTFNHDSSLAVAPGWDDVTGLGAPDPDYVTFKLPQR